MHTCFLPQIAKATTFLARSVPQQFVMSLPSLPENVPSSDALRSAAERVIPDAKIMIQRVEDDYPEHYTGPVTLNPLALMNELENFTLNVIQFEIQG